MTTTFFNIASAALIVCVASIFGASLWDRRKPQTLGHLQQDAAREILANVYYYSDRGTRLENLIDTLAKETGLTWIITIELTLEQKLHMLENCAKVLTDDEILVIVNNQKDNDLLRVKLIELYDTGQFSYTRGRMFRSCNYSADRFRRTMTQLAENKSFTA